MTRIKDNYIDIIQLNIKISGFNYLIIKSGYVMI